MVKRLLRNGYAVPAVRAPAYDEQIIARADPRVQRHPL